MRTISKSVENDARRLLCNILYHFETTGEWPIGGQVNQFGGYKAARDKAGAVASVIDRNWLQLIEEASSGNRVRRRYVMTELGRAAIMPPPPLPRIVPEQPVPFPEDPVQFAIYSYHLAFWQKKGRWPTGTERGNSFGTPERRRFSSERKRCAYEDLVSDGKLVLVDFWNARGTYNCYVIPSESPEYAEAHEVLYYAAFCPS
jgi:hypothetical protein